MGGEYAFFDCKDNKDKEGKETNLGIIDDINIFIFPIKKVPTKKIFYFPFPKSTITNRGS